MAQSSEQHDCLRASGSGIQGIRGRRSGRASALRRIPQRGWDVATCTPPRHKRLQSGPATGKTYSSLKPKPPARGAFLSKWGPLPSIQILAAAMFIL